MEQIKDFNGFLNEDNYGDDMKERGKLRDSYKKDKMIKSAIKFAIEKYTNNAEAMAHQEAEKTFDEWTKSKSKEYRSYESLEESNEERGYIEYEYDSKTKKIKRTGKSGVCSEYGIGWDVTFDQPRKYIKDLLDAGKPIRFYEYPSSPEKEIEQGINDFIAKINKP